MAALQAHEPALAAHAEAVERAFLQAAAALGRQRELAGQLAAHGRHFDSFTAVSDEQNPVRAAIALVDGALRTFDAFHDESTRLIETLCAQHEEIARLQQNGAHLERAISPLRIVHTLLRIEAATLPPELQAAFGALTQEIGGLDTRVREAFSRHFDALAETRGTIAVIVQHLQVQRDEDDRAAAEDRVAMRRSLAVLEKEIAGIRERNGRSVALVTQIERETSGVIVGLQYQDITRQKLEHVRSALGALPQRVESGAEGAAVAYVGHASRLQLLQLQAIDQDLGSAVEAIDSGLRLVVGRLARVESECLGEADCAVTASNVASIVDALGEMLANLQRSMRRVEANARKAAEAVRSFGGVTADLSDTIRELTWGIRLIALNAQVQAAQVARCDGLEVLARHTYVVSEQTSVFGDVFGRDLAAIHARLNALVSEATKFATASEQERRQLDSGVLTLAPRLKEQRELVVTALQEFPALLRQTSEHAAAVLKDCELAGVDRAPLHALGGELEALGTWCSEHGNEADTAAMRAEFAGAESRYTMESERAVHAAALSGGELGRRGEGSGIAVDAKAGRQPASEGLGDNVELF